MIWSSQRSPPVIGGSITMDISAGLDLDVPQWKAAGDRRVDARREHRPPAGRGAAMEPAVERREHTS